jgi:hypothetical protein
MKKLDTIILCMFCLESYSQNTGYLITFPGNDSVVYLTNSRVAHGLSFFHALAKDTANGVFYIENFKYSDIHTSPDKIRAMKAKFCLPGYKSKPGDLIFSMDSETDFIYYYHLNKEDAKRVNFD